MPEDQNLSQNNQTQPQATPASSWSPEVNQDATAVTPVPPVVSNDAVSEPVLSPASVKPPIMSDPDNDKEVVFRPETVIPEPESAATLATPQEITPPVQPEAPVQSPTETPTPASEGLTLPELTARFYQAKDKTELESTENEAALSAAVGPLNSEEQTITEPPSNLHESGHFTSLPGTAEIDTSAEEESFQNNIAAKSADTGQNQAGDTPAIKAQPQNPAPAPAVPDSVTPPKSGFGQKIILFLVLLFLFSGLCVLGYVGWTWWQK